MMTFCVIAPAAGLEKWARLSRTHLVLSHVRNPIYREFYRQRREAGDLVILDNGAYEGQMDPEKLLEAIIQYHPQVIVLPDILLGDAKQSFEIARDFHKTWRHQVDVQWMYVPQARPGELTLFSDYLARAVDEIKPEWIGIPRVLATDMHGAFNDIARADLCDWIRMRYGYDLHVHALGMAAGNLKDLEYLRQAGCNSVDSSAPVWRGWNGFDIEDTMWNTKGTECDFDARPLESIENEKLIIANLRKVKIL